MATALGPLIWEGVEKGNKQIVAPLLWTKETINQGMQLTLEVESFKSWLADIKQFVDKLLAARVNLCSLMDFIDTLNAVQLFFYSNFINPTKVAAGFVQAWPLWYRTELMHAGKHITDSLNSVLLELQTFELILQDQLLRDDVSLDDLKESINNNNNQCARFAEYYRTQLNERSSWDICKKCTVRDKRFITLGQSYKRTIKNKDMFQDVQDALENGQPVPEVLLPPMLGQHGDKGLVGHLRSMWNKIPTEQVYLGNPLTRYDTDTESSESEEHR